MRLVLKHKIINAVNQIEDSQKILGKLSNINGMCQEFLQMLQKKAIEIGTLYEKEKEIDPALIERLEAYCEYIYLASLKQGDDFRKAYEQMQSCIEEIREYIIHTIPTSIKVVFFPYQYSMWDSLESIWKEASQDGRICCQVVPIPYYDLKEDDSLGEMHYEGDLFEKKYPIIDYREYDLEKEQPDIIYIHNPYDECNRLTRIEPRFFSTELKKQENVLVYVPYYMEGSCERYENVSNFFVTPGGINSDRIILQSENLKKAYEFCGFQEKKLLVTGSPKVDFMYELSNQKLEICKELEDVISNRKVILLNSSIQTFLNNKGWIYKIREYVHEIISDNELALIWRPHPLLRQTICKMSPESKKAYDRLISEIREAKNAFMDEEKDFSQVFKVSDGMISDYSSMILQYTFTEKPVLILAESGDKENCINFCDYSAHYFLEDGTTVREFIENIKSGKDDRKEVRMKRIKESIANSDGTCGEKTHKAILKEICFWE